MNRSRILLLIILAALLLIAAAGLITILCLRAAEKAPAALTPEPTEAAVTPTPRPTDVPETELTVTEPTTPDMLIRRISETETLQRVTLADGVLANSEIDVLRARFPEIAFIYCIAVGSAFVSPDTTELSVDQALGAVTAADIAEAKPYLLNLSAVHLGTCTPKELADATELLGDSLALDYNIALFGKSLAPDAETLDLSDGTAPDETELREALPYLIGLKKVLLGDRSADPAGAVAFMEAFSDLEFVCTYSVSYAGKTYSESTESMNLDGVAIDDVDALTETLALLPRLTSVSMLNCGLDNDEMSAICDEFPGIRFLWEIDLGFWGTLRTDATAFTTRSGRSEAEDAHRLTSEEIRPLRFCVDLVALDLGHQRIEDISFLSTLHKLQVLILADNRISDISALAEMPELVWVELFINHISDLSPLSELENLKDLNVCTNSITDLSPLQSVSSLERVWYSGNKIRLAEHQALMAALPDCLCNRDAWPETEGGWRKHPRYDWMIAFFEKSPRY